jgi:hypothetical protein
MRKHPASPGRLALAVWSGACVAVLLTSLWAAWPHPSGGEVAFVMFVLTLPISPATGLLLNAVDFGHWLPAAEPWQSLAIWLAFFVPGLGQWLALGGLWRLVRRRVPQPGTRSGVDA